MLTSIKQRLMRRFPHFDEKQLGFSGFKKLMGRVAQEGNIKLVTAGLVDWATMVDESGPAEGGIDPAGASEPQPVRGRSRRPSPTQITPADEELPTIEEEAAEDTEPLTALEDHDPSAIVAQSEDTPGEFVESPEAPMSPALEELISEATAGVDLPDGPGDGLNSQRIADLIVMADTLEHREGISHVAFNFLVAEVCQALEQGLEAEYAEITQRWAQVYSRTYVSKMFRELSSAKLFKRGWHSWRDETSGHQRRRRTFNLDRVEPTVEQVLKSRSVPDPSAYDVATEEFPVPQAPSPADEDYYATALADGFHPEEEDTEQPVKAEVPFFSRLFRGRRDD